MAIRRGGPISACPVPSHAGSHVVSHGKRTTAGTLRQRFRCTPAGKAAHYFDVVVSEGVPLPVWSPPPRCSDHPKGHVVRDGRYAETSERPRQRYRCYPHPADRTEFHRFTPPLPRDHVHAGADRCDDCEELRGTHRGDQAVSRRQSWSARLVAESLRDLARGRTYAAVSQAAREATGRTRTRGSGSQSKSASAEKRNRWHTAADWTETFSPVLWEHVERQLRDRATKAVAERDRLAAAGLDNPNPITIVIDDIPVHAKWTNENDKASSRKIYSVMVVGETEWKGGVDRGLKLRLVRAYPANDSSAWKLVLDELGYVPDVIVSDCDVSQMNAITELYASAPVQPAFIPSLYHTSFNVELALFSTPGAYTKHKGEGMKTLRPEFKDHLDLLTRSTLTTLSSMAWSQWWDDLEAMLTTFNLAVEPTRVRRVNYEAVVAASLPVVRQYPQLPLSTGGIESSMRKHVKPVLAGRAQVFANLERTNRLFDLVVCDQHGLFNKTATVIRLLRNDSSSNDGWSSPLRMIADAQPPTATQWNGRYSSLRDQLLMRELARKKGLA